MLTACRLQTNSLLLKLSCHRFLLSCSTSYYICVTPQDATANDIPSETFDVQGYPTVYFRSASGKISQYDGNRTKDDIIDFIEKNRDKSGQPEQVKEQAKERVNEQGKDEL